MIYGMLVDLMVGMLIKKEIMNKNIWKSGGRKAMKKTKNDISISELLDLILKGIALAMGVAVVVLSFLNEIDTTSAIGMLGLGLACLAVTQFSKKEE